MKILAQGELLKLNRMPTSKAFFPIAHWKEKGVLFTVGGFALDYQI